MSRDFTVALVGNPNCGKTTLFNDLTGTHQKVGNWPGVTVEKKTGQFRHADTLINVVDLPGTYSLHASCHDDSIDQQIA
ncbi:MAG: GTP-binding protein, partial [Gammaproteobacteria bacterium]